MEASVSNMVMDEGGGWLPLCSEVSPRFSHYYKTWQSDWLVNIGHTTMSLLLTGKQIFLFIEDLHQLGKSGF